MSTHAKYAKSAGWRSIEQVSRFRMDRGYGEWRLRAACRGVETRLFFPVSEKGEPETIAAAKAICAECPVRQECLEYAVAYKEENGIWGGLTEDELRSLRRRRQRRAS